MNTRSAILTLGNNYLKQGSTFGHKILLNRNTAICKYATLQCAPAKAIGLQSKLKLRNNNGPIILSQTSSKIVPVCQTQSRSTFDPCIGCCDYFNLSMQTSVSNREGIRIFHTLTNRFQNDLTTLSRDQSTSTNNKEPTLSRKEQLKLAVKDYGSTVIVFHVGISLISLGTCYLLVTSGVDMGKLLMPLGISGDVATSTGTFVTAYAIHKVFAPVRISITLAATPFIVRYLRSIGFLKKPKV